jgi:hypothetical protein
VRRPSGRHLLVLVVALLVVTGGAGVAVANAPARLSTSGPTDATGTSATAVFEVGDRTIRQVRYRDRGVLAYRFVLHNDGTLPVTVTGAAPPEPAPTLFIYLGVRQGDSGTPRFTVPAGGAVPVLLRLRMESCEHLSARAGSFATEVVLRTSRAGGLVDEAVTVTLPEEVHTGSPREAFCPRSTASSRPPG